MKLLGPSPASHTKQMLIRRSVEFPLVKFLSCWQTRVGSAAEICNAWQIRAAQKQKQFGWRETWRLQSTKVTPINFKNKMI